MSASRTARWLRWAGLPAVVALFFATSVAGATPQATPVTGALPAVLQALVVPGPHTVGQRPDLPVVEHAGHRRMAPDPTGSAWLPERAGIGVAAGWRQRRDSDTEQVQGGREAHRVRGPPGRRTADALS